MKSNKVLVDKHKTSLKFLKDDIVKQRVMNKLVNKGITLKVFRNAYLKDRKTGINILLTLNVNKKARVTSDIKMVDAIKNKMKLICDNETKKNK